MKKQLAYKEIILLTKKVFAAGLRRYTSKNKCICFKG